MLGKETPTSDPSLIATFGTIFRLCIEFTRKPVVPGLKRGIFE